jgi:hypothetical protein
LSKLKNFGDETRGMRREVVRQTKGMKVKGTMGKVEGIKRGALPYAATSSPTLIIMILQVTTRFPYFHFHIYMFKW